MVFDMICELKIYIKGENKKVKSIKEYVVIDYQDENVTHYHYEDEDGAHYDDLSSFLQCHILGFCGCGMPESNLEFIYHLLLLKQKWSDRELNYHSYNEELTKYLTNNIEHIKWFLDYWLDKKNITTHGGNVSGSWVDDRNFFDALKQWKKENDKENKNND